MGEDPNLFFASAKTPAFSARIRSFAANIMRANNVANNDRRSVIENAIGGLDQLFTYLCEVMSVEQPWPGPEADAEIGLAPNMLNRTGVNTASRRVALIRPP